MKTCLLILGTTGFALALALNAQTNSPDSTPKSETADATARTVVPTNTITIDSDRFFFNGNTRLATYTGNVRVKDPQMDLTCDILTAHIPQSDKSDKSDKIDSIVAEHNVVIDATDNDGWPVHATCDKAVYTFRVTNMETNKTIKLTGTPAADPEVKSHMRSGTFTMITWDLVNNTIEATNSHMMIGNIISKPQAGQRTNAQPAAPEKN